MTLKKGDFKQDYIFTTETEPTRREVLCKYLLNIKLVETQSEAHVFIKSRFKKLI